MNRNHEGNEPKPITFDVYTGDPTALESVTLIVQDVTWATVHANDRTTQIYHLMDEEESSNYTVVQALAADSRDFYIRLQQALVEQECDIELPDLYAYGPTWWKSVEIYMASALKSMKELRSYYRALDLTTEAAKPEAMEAMTATANAGGSTASGMTTTTCPTQPCLCMILTTYPAQAGEERQGKVANMGIGGVLHLHCKM